MTKRFTRGLKLGGYFLLGFLLVVGSGRLVQKALDSVYHGERAPYLQMPAPHAMSLRWQSVEQYKGRVNLGLRPESLNRPLLAKTAAEQHEFRLGKLEPLTRYYYSAGSETDVVYQGSDYWFVTPPKTGEAVPVRFWVTGDVGKAGIIQQQVRDAMLQWLQDNPRVGRAYLDFWLTTGDNAYRSGSNQQFQDAFFQPYQDILRNIPVWPAYGNHDARRWAFFDIFSLPEHGESGGVPSHTEHYYSFDYANIHFVFLDSQDSDRDHDGKMARWLTTDLKTNVLPWTIVVFHHPPYSKGSHDSDDRDDSDGRLHDMRENLVPILERYDVDLVLTGHSHVYERSHFMTCHYGDSSTLKDAMILDKDRRFEKSLHKQSNQGTVYAVVGSSSKIDNASLDHPVMAVAKSEAGSMVVDVNGNELVARFINDRGFETDSFSIHKVKGIDPQKPKQLCH
jgi:hypothetical protein